MMTKVHVFLLYHRIVANFVKIMAVPFENMSG